MSEDPNYPPAWSYRTVRPKVDEVILAESNLDRGGPWTDFGGFYLGTSEQSTSKNTTGQFASIILKAQIKPTAVVTA